MSEPVAWVQSNHLQLARQGVHLVRMAPTQHQSDYIPLYTADAIREAVLAERERCCGIIYGMCESDNVAQRTVDAIKRGAA